MGSDLEECWCRMFSFSCLGHQPAFDGAPATVCLRASPANGHLLSVSMLSPSPIELCSLSPLMLKVARRSLLIQWIWTLRLIESLYRRLEDDVGPMAIAHALLGRSDQSISID